MFPINRNTLPVLLTPPPNPVRHTRNGESWRRQAACGWSYHRRNVPDESPKALYLIGLVKLLQALEKLIDLTVVGTP